ncbi:MAG: dephospho-CoA kinase [Treponema sp.]|jgi:dephospho-CoA kinase|nr:dephospho-CoA kinase [Treponema sp.]
MAKIIGLTGMYCAGKNRIAALLEERGLPALDVDKLGHQAIEAAKEAIVRRFGPEVLAPEGKDRQGLSIDRRRLGEKVFGKPGELADLEAIVHPEANRLTDEWIKGKNGETCVINAALLHKSSAFEKLDFIIIVQAPFFDRLRRARQRDHLPWAALLKRFGSQREFMSQYLNGNADTYRVDNRGYSKTLSRRLKRKLEDRIDAILSGEGIR